MQVPLVDLKTQYRSIKEEIDNAIQSVIADAAFVGGAYVKKFAEEYAQACGTTDCIPCANGTDAIYIALKALEIGEGDEVITTALSWISTSEAISQTGARVVFSDIEPEYFTIDPNHIENNITKRTRAIIPVHIYGQPADMDAVMTIANKYGLAVIEDCAQAHFSRYNGKLVGTFGNAGTFSFYPGKNLGAYGDAGAIISNDDQFSRKARMFANHGSLIKHQHEQEGINSRLDGIQAAILSVKLKHVQKWNQCRSSSGEIYDRLLGDVDSLSIPLVRKGCEHVYHLYVIRSRMRDAVQMHLKSVGIDAEVHYPVALPFLKAYKYLGHSVAEYPVAYQYQSEVLSLPIYPELTESMCTFVAREVMSSTG